MGDYINHSSDVVIPRLEKRIAELEAQVEALAPKSTVVSEWIYLSPTYVS